MAHPSNEMWLISVPGDPNPQEAWERLNRGTAALSMSNKFPIPELKVGTLDQLVGLSGMFLQDK